MSLPTTPTPTTALTSLTTSELPKPKARKQLNELQIELLQILYKFRFGNAKLIAQYQDQSIRNINVRLTNLLEQEYIGRSYDSSYRINRRPATYYLLPKAIRLLKTNPELDPKGLHLLYYNHKAKLVFVNHCLRLFRMYLKLNEIYGEDLEFFASTELAEQQYFPRPLPDGYLTFSGNHSEVSDCMLELLESSTSLSRLRQRVNRYMAHHELGTCEGDYPHILLVCDNIGLEREIQRHVAKTMDYRGILGLECYTTTIKALLSSNSRNKAIWSDAVEEDVLTSL